MTLANARADRVKQVRVLAGRSARRKQGLFLAEGPQSAREAVRHAAARVRDLYITLEAAERHPEILRAAREAGVRVHGGSPEVLEAMSADCQGVLAVVESAVVGLDQALSGRAPSLVAVLANVRDPGNAGAAIRVADAAGADAVVLAGDAVDVENPKVVRSSAGSLFHLPVVTGVSLADAVAAARARGLHVVAADGGGSVELGGPGADGEQLALPTAWVFGNEAWGLAAEDIALADEVVRIPVFGRAESLNLATAVAVALYGSALARARQA